MANRKKSNPAPAESKKKGTAAAGKGKASPTPAAGKGAADQNTPAEHNAAAAEHGTPAAEQTPAAKDALKQQLKEMPAEEQEAAAKRLTAALLEGAKISLEKNSELFHNLSDMGKELVKMQQQYAEPAQKMAETVQGITEGLNNIIGAWELQKEFFSVISRSEAWENILENVAVLKQNANSIAAQIQEMQIYLDLLGKELQKPEYEGLSAEQLEELADDPAADPKYKQLWQQAQDNARAALKEKTQQEEPEKKKQTPRQKAIDQGALITMENHVAAFSEVDLQNALTSAQIFQLPDKDETMFDKDTGQLNPMLAEKAKDKLQKMTKLHTAFLFAVTQLFLLQSSETENGLLSFYVPAICRELHIDIREYSTKRKKDTGKQLPTAEAQAEKIISLITPFDSLVGKTKDGSYYRVLAFHGYDESTKTITISAPYIQKLLQTGDKSKLNRLLHSSVVNERNQGAVELASRILAGVLRRGGAPDPKQTRKPTPTKTVRKTKEGDTVTTFFEAPQKKAQGKRVISYRPKFQTIIDDCPQLLSELDDIEKKKDETKNWRQLYNNKLKYAFESAYKIIMEKSEAPYYFENFRFEDINPTTGKLRPPTYSTLNRKLVITHTGRNKNYTDIVEP